MKPKHTPGPWVMDPQLHVQDAEGKALFYSQDSGYSNAENGRLQRWDRNDEDREANARLIAAAPELLEALIRLHEYMKDSPTEQWHVEFLAKAIAKATDGAE